MARTSTDPQRTGRAPDRPGASWIAVGLYGVVSYGVAQRTHEIGNRMALGTHGPRVVRQLVAGGLKLVVIGAGLELTLAVVASRLLSGRLFEIGRSIR